MVRVPPEFVPFTGKPYSIAEDQCPSSHATSQLQTNRCWSCLTGIWDAFVGLLVRIRNCFCRCFGRGAPEVAHSQPEIPRATAPMTPITVTQPGIIPSSMQGRPIPAPPLTTSPQGVIPLASPPAPVVSQVEDIENDAEDTIPLSPTVALFFDTVDAMDESVQAAAIVQQGLQLFVCLPIQEKYWMLKKIVLEYNLPLTDYFPAFLKAINDKPLEDNVCVQPPLAQDKIREVVSRAFVNKRGRTVENLKLIMNWLNGQDKDVDASHAVKEAFKGINVQALMVPKTATSKEGAFVLRIVDGALAGKRPDDVLSTAGGLTDFNRLSNREQLMSIESLMVIAGSEKQQLINPTWIIRLINVLPREIRKKIAERIPNEKRKDLFVNVQTGEELLPNLTMKIVQSEIYPILKNDKQYLL